MPEITLFDRVRERVADTTFQLEKKRLLIRIFVLSAVIIFSVETLLMLTLKVIYPLPEPLIFLLDGLLLVTILFPLNYYLVVRPMLEQINKHRSTNQELLKSSEILDQFFSINDILIAYMDRDFNFIRVNQAYADTDERKPEYFVGKNHFVLFPDEDNRRIFQGVIDTGIPYNVIEKPFEYAANPERGTTYWDWNLLPVKDAQDRVIALLLVLSNVTERKLAQVAHAESERRFKAVFDQAFQHIALLDPQGRIMQVNQTALDFNALTEKKLVGTLLWDAGVWDPPLEPDGPLQEAIKLAQTGQPARCEMSLRKPDGQLAVMDITIKPLLDENGRILMLIYESRDITERIMVEEAMLRSEQELQRLYQVEKEARSLADVLRNASQALSGSLDTTTVLERLLDHLYSVVPFTSAHIGLLDDENHLLVRLARGEELWEESERMLGKRFEMSDLPILQPVLREQQILIIADSTLDYGAPFPASDGHSNSWLGLPLQAGEHVIGFCTLEHHCAARFTDQQIHWASLITSQAAVAIQNAWLFEQVSEGRARLQALSRRLVEVQENERHYIARELHDEAGQALASLMVGLRLVERDAADPGSVVARCVELKQIADDVLENLHRLAIDLRPASLDHLGLVAALRQHTELVSDQHGLPVQFETIGKIDRLPGESETAIYRIVQEALTNIIRHANATRVDVLLERRADCLIVIVEDNGIGFDPEQPKISQLGMLGMRERADMLGGTLSLESTPGRGTTIILEVPCPSES